jgi:DNA-binding LacI/PurR family transcriptional regulator
MPASSTSTRLARHEIVREYVLGAIRSGRLKVGEKSPSEYSLSRRFKVNKTTCNKALSGLVAQGYLERRRGAGTFVANPIADKIPAIGIWMNLRPSSYFSQLLISIQEGAFARGYALCFFQSRSFDSERGILEHQRHIVATGIKGIIVNRPDQREIPSIPNLYLDTSAPHKTANQVQIDHAKGGELLAEHFMDNNHTQVAFVCQDSAREDLLMRAHGFLQAFEARGFLQSASRLHFFSKAKHDLPAVLGRILKADHRISGIGFDSIHVANEAIRVLRHMKIRVPENISVAAFGNAGPGDQAIPITAIDQRPVALGHLAVDCLIDQIEGRTKGPVKIVSDVELKKGETVLRLPDGKKSK